MVAPVIGSLLVKMKGLGIARTAKQVGGFQGKFGKMSKSIGPQMKKLTAGFKKFGLIAGAAFGALIAASPLLRARMEILSLRVGELVRVFGDALGPVIEGVTDIVKFATEAWESLPEPLREAILFGVQVVAVIGLLALAFLALDVAMSPVTAIILGIIAVFAMFHLAYTQNLMGFADAVQRLFGSVIRIFEGFIKFFTSIFSGDLQGAWDAIRDIFSGAIDFIIDYVTLIPRAILGVIDYLTGGAVTQMFEAGYALFNSFVLGLQKAFDDTTGIIRDVLYAIFGEGGGGHEEGRVREQGIAGGGGGGSTTAINYNIESIALNIEGEPEEFENEFDSSIRRVIV